MSDQTLEMLLAALDEAFDRRSWHGTNLRGSLRGLPPDALVWRPAPGRHNIWEIALHAAYWKYAIRRQLTSEKRGSFPLSGSNFFPRPAADRKWKDDLALLADQHRRLRQAVAALRERDLGRRKGAFTVAGLVRGAAAHDLYHAGQIQLLKRLRSA